MHFELRPKGTLRTWRHLCVTAIAGAGRGRNQLGHVLYHACHWIVILIEGNILCTYQSERHGRGEPQQGVLLRVLQVKAQ